MKRSTLYALGAVATLGLAAVAVPVVAQQGMMGGHGGMMGPNSYAMRNFDSNKDGKLSPEEMTAGIAADLKTYDKDGNGTLSLEEFAVMHAAHTRTMMVRAFQMHDEDGDGQVTAAEMETVGQMMQQHMADGMDGHHRRGGMMGDGQMGQGGMMGQGGNN